MPTSPIRTHASVRTPDGGRIAVSVGGIALIEDLRDPHEPKAFGAVIAAIGAAHVELTFTPRDAPRTVSLAAVLACTQGGGDTLQTVPHYQPKVDARPRRRQRRRLVF